MSRSYKWQVVGMLWLVCCFNYADRQSIFSVFPKLKEEFGLSAVQLGLVGSMFAWLYAAAAPFAGFLGDRFPRKRMILGGCLFWSALTVLTGACVRFWQFVTVRALVGLGEASYFPASMSLLSDYHGRATRSRAMAVHQSGVYVGTIAGGWLGAWFAERYGWRVGFYFFGATGALLALLLLRYLREPARGAADVDTPGKAASEPAPSVREVIRIVFSKPTAWLLMAVFVGSNCVATIFLTWTPTFLVDKFHFRLTSAGLSGAVFIHLASAASVPFGGWAADLLARRMAGGRMLVQAAGLLLGATFVAVVGLTSNVGTLLAAMTAFGLCKGLYDSNIWASLYDVIEPRARGTAVGIMNAIGWGGGALGPLFVGIMTQYGRHERAVDNMSEAIASGAVIYVLGGLLLLFLVFRRAPRDILPQGLPAPAGP